MYFKMALSILIKFLMLILIHPRKILFLAGQIILKSTSLSLLLASYLSVKGIVMVVGCDGDGLWSVGWGYKKNGFNLTNVRETVLLSLYNIKLYKLIT